MKSHMKLWVLALMVAIVTLNFQTSSGLTVDKNGGYNVVLAIRSDEAKPANVENYINNIKNTFRTLSGKMWIATRESFYIANLEIILPKSWGVEGDIRIISYSTADIRISSANTLPYVENPNLCGLPGDFIELPKSLFDNANTGDLGENWKVLLVSWARYRWGAYEEHGVPGDKRFPYFTRDFEAAEDEAKWLPNGCTNAEDNKLVGVYRNLDGTPCDPTSTDDLALTCRFYPDKSSNAEVTSSLMHFHFMESIYQFCDATTHQKNVPTKQNLYCDNKSVMETIESSPDYKAIETKNTYVPVLKTKVSVAAATPSLYVLLDTGIADNDDASVINQVVPLIGNFFESIDTNTHQELIVGVGEFPSAETGPFLKSLVPLGFLSDNRAQVVEAIGNRRIGYNPNQDFGVALRQAADVIRKSSPGAGGNILFLKAASARNKTDYSSEKELELALRRENIKLFSLEIVDVNKTRVNLGNVATSTQGDPIALSRADNTQIPTVVNTWLEQKVLAEYSAPPTPSALDRIIYSGIVSPVSNFSIPVLSGTQKLTFLLTSVYKLQPTQLLAGIVTPQVVIRATFTEGQDFGQNRYVYTGTLDTAGWALNEVSFVYPGSDPSQLTVLSTGTQLPADISVTVATSAVNNAIDLGAIQNPDAPFVITAVIKQNNRPVTGAHVLATISLGDQMSEQIPLPDAPYGLSNPEGDGIYSDIFLVPRDGDYTISVTVTKGTTTSTTSVTLNGASTFFIPPSQEFTTNPPVPFPTGATKSATLGSTIHVINADKFVPTVQTIRDLTVEEDEVNERQANFEFTAPRVLELGNTGTGPNLYKLYETEDPELLIDLDVANLPAGVKEVLSKQGATTPGVAITVSLNRSKTDVPLYFAAVAFNGQTPSHVSNIVTLAPLEGPGENTTNAPEPEPEQEENKAWIKTTGGIITIVAIVLVCFIAAGGGYWYLNKRRQRRGNGSVA